ncbi:MAG: chitobiase/beta-hexosaminidase C-terminal domain-containing protein [Thermoleophilia bacterium]
MEREVHSGVRIGPARGAARGVARRAVLLFVLCVAGAAALLTHPPGAAAFNSGYHYDLTADALAREGGGRSAIQVAQVANCYDDMFQIAISVLEDPRAAAIHDSLDAIYGPAELRRLSVQYEHFADCPDYAALKARWDRLLVGSYAAVEDVKQLPAGSRGVPLLVVLGQGLHEVQDFYAHSNWAHATAFPGWSHPANTIRDETWFEVAEGVKQNLGLTVGPHDQMNKDWAGRPYFDRAYHEAFLASWEWTKMVRAWAGEAVWAEAMAYSDGDVAQEARFIRLLSMYAGVWKGPGSADDSELLQAILAYRTIHLGLWSPYSSSQTIDAYLIAWKRYCPIMTADPAEKPYPTTLPSSVPRPQWLTIDTQRVAERTIQGDRIDSSSPPDFYAVMTVNGVSYDTGVVIDADNISPYYWRTLVPLEPDVASLSLSYALWDADVDEDELCDIVPGAAWIWTWSGSPDDLPTTPIETEGLRGETGSVREGDEAYVSLHFMREPVSAAELVGTAGGHGWFRSAVTATLTAQDRGGTGIERLDYAIVPATFAMYTGPITIAAEGATTLRYFATDSAGNLEDAHDTVVRIDSHTPTPVALNHPSVRRGRTCRLEYEVRDDLPSSGTALTAIKVRTKAGKLVKTLGGKTWQAVNTPWSLKFAPGKLKPGRYSVTVYTVDYAGNQQSQVARSYVTVK